MTASLRQILREIHVIGERVFRPVGIEDIAGVADRPLRELALLAHGVDRDAHVFDPVQAVEDAKQVHAGLRGLCDEEADHIVRITRVADAVGATQQHLQQVVGHLGPQRRQPFPWVLVQEPHGHVERRAAPAFDGEQLW
jgi:hypothetical protein